ncbi:pyridoxal phosphate-dependent aminotransferase [Myxococcota bacterium]|nr:pyridoxal phosphate-dependent aminotransferase [Myxococcota bacterium]
MPVAKGISEAMGRASWIRRMFEKGGELKARYGAENVFDFTLGNPSLEPPPEFFDALAEISTQRDSGLHRYMPNAGFPAVREAIAQKLEAEGTFKGIGTGGVVMTVGAGGALNVTLKALLEPGDEVMILAPYFVEYLFYIRNHGGEPVVAETNAEFDLDIDEIAAKITSKTKVIILNTPNNPTGRIFPESSLKALAKLLGEKEKEVGHPIYILADEPYRELVYIDNPPLSPAAYHPNSFLLYSWSKSLSIPGERIGFIAINPAIDDPVGLMDALTFCNRTLGFVNAPAAMQLVVAKLLNVTIDVGWYKKRRDMLVDGLRDIGFDLIAPEGTFYIFPKSPDPDAVAFVNRAMEEAKVLLVPGGGFGRDGYFRISYCVDERTVQGGLEALRKLMR